MRQTEAQLLELQELSFCFSKAVNSLTKPKKGAIMVVQ